MLDLFSDIYNEVLSRLNASANSTLYTVVRAKSAVNQSYGAAMDLFSWPGQEKGRKTGSVASQDYYDFPQRMKSDSIFRLTVDGNEYSKVEFEDYLKFKVDNATSTDRKFSQFGRQFFITPTPTTNGSGNVIVWGLETADKLVGDTDTTFFSYSEPLGNEAIVKMAVAILKAKGNNKNEGMVEYKEAIQDLAVIHKKVADRKQRDQSLNRPFFDIPDYYRGRGAANSNVIGNFP